MTIIWDSKKDISVKNLGLLLYSLTKIISSINNNKIIQVSSTTISSASATRSNKYSSYATRPWPPRRAATPLAWVPTTFRPHPWVTISQSLVLAAREPVVRNRWCRQPTQRAAAADLLPRTAPSCWRRANQANAAPLSSPSSTFWAERLSKQFLYIFLRRAERESYLLVLLRYLIWDRWKDVWFCFYFETDE